MRCLQILLALSLIFSNVIVLGTESLPIKRSGKEFTISDYKKVLERNNLNPDDFTAPDFEQATSETEVAFSMEAKKTVVFQGSTIPKGASFVNFGGNFEIIRHDMKAKDRTITFKGIPCYITVNLNERGQFCYCILSKPYTLKGHTIKEGSIHYIDGKFNGFVEKEKGIPKFFTFNDKDQVVEKDIKGRSALMDDCKL